MLLLLSTAVLNVLRHARLSAGEKIIARRRLLSLLLLNLLQCILRLMMYTLVEIRVCLTIMPLGCPRP